MTTNEIVAAALALPEQARWDLLGRLLESVDSGDPAMSEDEWEAAWLPELDRRVAELERDPGSALPAEAVFAELNAKYQPKP
jgi:putative addiction module component (TIGR02574 family)